MTAEDAVQEAEAEMTHTFQELNAQIKTVNTLKEALKRSHRCWPSIWGWGWSLALLVYVIVMHSFHFSDQERLTQQLDTQAVHIITLEAEIKLLQHSIRRSVVWPPKKPWWKK